MTSRQTLEDSGRGNVDIIRLISHKLRSKRVKAATIVSFCENLDVNRDSLIHMSDMTGVLNHVLGKDSVSQREMLHLAKHLSPDSRAERGQINYFKFIDLFSDSFSSTLDLGGAMARGERWMDGEGAAADEQWASQRGTVGEWLRHAACPAEVNNYKKFIACLEEFERSSGMKCIHKEGGFVVPLGPDLTASVSFFTK
jgi:hypothetical protein